MFKRTLVSSLKYIAKHPMMVRIAFLTGFVQTLMSFWRLGYTFYVILERNTDISNLQGNLRQYIKAIFDMALKDMSFGLILFLGFFGLIGYVVLYPFGHAMMVGYAQTESKGKSFNIAIKRYFTVTITEGILGLITFGSWHLWILRYFYHRGILSNILIQIFIFLVGSFILVTTFLYSYANINSVVDNFSAKKPVQQSREALQNSAKLAMNNPLITFKFLLLSLILEIRFFLTTVFVIGIPVLVIRLMMQIGLIAQENVVTIVLVTAGVLLFASMYINSIIDAFFIVYRYKLYKELQEKAE